MTQDADFSKRVVSQSEYFARGDLFRSLFTGVSEWSLFLIPDLGPDWKRHRKGLQPAFGPTHLRNAAVITSQVYDTAKALIDQKVCKQGSLELDLYQFFTSFGLDFM